MKRFFIASVCLLVMAGCVTTKQSSVRCPECRCPSVDLMLPYHAPGDTEASGVLYLPAGWFDANPDQWYTEEEWDAVIDSVTESMKKKAM